MTLSDDELDLQIELIVKNTLSEFHDLECESLIRISCHRLYNHLENWHRIFGSKSKLESDKND